VSKWDRALVGNQGFFVTSLPLLKRTREVILKIAHSSVSHSYMFYIAFFTDLIRMAIGRIGG
jgi:hypothetical protein